MSADLYHYGLRGLLERADPRRVLECRRCCDTGIVGEPEDVCPDCEGGLWRERESWRWFVHRQPWFGFRIDLIHHRLPRISRDWPA